MEKVGSLLSYDKKIVLGRGTYSYVYHGFLKNNNGSNKAVAVKRFQIGEVNTDAIQQEVELMKRAGDHINILRYICTEEDDYFLYIITELCEGTLDNYVKGEYKGPKFKNEREILLQVTQGLAHLHSLGIIHRDIKPNNILIFVPSDGYRAEPRMKLADFGISKGLNAGREDFTNTSKSNPKGTRGWMAPEVYQNERIDFKVDIFPLGCIFAYILSGGKHPFGDDPDERLVRIKDQQPMLMAQQDFIGPYSRDGETFALIKAMLEIFPSKRPTVRNVLDSIFFNERINEENVLGTNFFLLVSVEVRTKILLDICLSLSLEFGVKKSKMEYDFAYEQLKNLLKWGKVNANTREERGWTPLQLLCVFYTQDNLIDLVKLLIENGADVDATNHFGRTPLHILSERYKNDNLIALVKVLIENGTDVNAKDKHGQTPLHLLCRYYKNDNLIDVVRLLIQKGADVSAKNNFGFTPLHFLSEDYQKDNLIDLVKLLIQNGTDLNAKDYCGQTPLHFLCRWYKKDNLIDLVQLLIQNGSDINANDFFGWTPLFYLRMYNKNMYMCYMYNKN